MTRRSFDLGRMCFIAFVAFLIPTLAAFSAFPFVLLFSIRSVSVWWLDAISLVERIWEITVWWKNDGGEVGRKRIYDEDDEDDDDD